jgi:hypothetical protein
MENVWFAASLPLSALPMSEVPEALADGAS